MTGRLYIVATPIGNLGDLSQRAQQVLKNVDLIIAEDTRHSHLMLSKLGIQTPLQTYHEYNEKKATKVLIPKIKNGSIIALISDAGTPLISDPGYQLVAAAHRHGLHICPIPGPSALTAALSAAGLPTDRFMFIGYPPSQPIARRKLLESLTQETCTLVFYEAPHRIIATIDDAIEIFGKGRTACLAKEISKTHETIERGPLEKLADWLRADPYRCKGEFVLIITKNNEPKSPDFQTLLTILLESMSVKEAVNITARVYNVRRNQLYKKALELTKNRLST